MVNKTRVDKYALKQLIKIIYKKQKIMLGVIGIFFITWGLFLISINLIYLLVVGLGIIFFVFFVFIFERIILKREMDNKLFKSLTHYVYEFGEDSFKVSTFCNDDLYSYSLVKYKEIYRIIETKNYLFIFISKLDAYILLKHAMSYNELTELKDKLRENIINYE